MTNRYIQNLIDSTFLVAILSGIIYIFSFGYYKGFFERLSIPYEALDLPITFYLSIGYIPSIILLLIMIAVVNYIFLGFDDSDLNKKYNEIKSILKQYGKIFFIFIILSIISYFLTIKLSTRFEFFFTLVLLITILCAILIMILSVYFIKIYIINSEKIKVKSILFISATIFVVILIIIPSYVGDFYAGELVAGRVDSLGITFEPTIVKNNTMNDPLILVMYHSGYYYIVEQHDPAPDNAKLYIIQANKVNETIINTIKGRSFISRLVEYVSYLLT